MFPPAPADKPGVLHWTSAVAIIPTSTVRPTTECPPSRCVRQIPGPTNTARANPQQNFGNTVFLRFSTCLRNCRTTVSSLCTSLMLTPSQARADDKASGCKCVEQHMSYHDGHVLVPGKGTCVSFHTLRLVGTRCQCVSSVH